MIGAAAIGEARTARGSRRSWAALAVGLLLLAIAIMLVLSGLLVRLHNDRDHQAVLPASVPPGGSVSGELTLTNTGLLPVEVELAPRSAGGTPPPATPAKVTLSVVSTGDGRLLYEGPLGPTGILLSLERGQAAHLRLTVRSDDPAAGAAVPLGYDYYWTARAAIPWLWWIPAILFIGLLVAAGYWRPGGRGALQ